MWEKELFNQKQKGKNKTIITITIIVIIKRKKRREKEIKKLIKMTMESIILMISWHHKTMKMRNTSKIKHIEKKVIITSWNKNNNYNSNNNALKDEQNQRFEKKETLIWTRNWSGLYAFLKYKHYTKKQFKTTAGRKK